MSLQQLSILHKDAIFLSLPVLKEHILMAGKFWNTGTVTRKLSFIHTWKKKICMIFQTENIHLQIAIAAWWENCVQASLKYIHLLHMMNSLYHFTLLFFLSYLNFVTYIYSSLLWYSFKFQKLIVVLTYKKIFKINFVLIF